MKIKLNIIPEKRKKERILQKRIGAILRFGYKTFFVFVFFLLILISMRTILEIEYRAVSQKPEAANEIDMDIEGSENLLTSTNKISEKVEKSVSETLNWTVIFEELSSACPDGIKITSVHAELEHVKLSGFSKTREAFLTFEERLKSSGMKNIVSPVSNIVAPENFEFEVEFDLDKKYFADK